MRQITSILFVLTFFLVQGCATTGSRSREHIEIFRDGEKPTRPFKDIGVLTDDGGLGEQGEIEQQMIRKAKRMGADALLFEKLVQTGDELKGLGLVKSYLYKSHVVVFQ